MRVDSTDDIRCPAGHLLEWDDWSLGEPTLSGNILNIPLTVRVKPCQQCPITVTFTVAT